MVEKLLKDLSYVPDGTWVDFRFKPSAINLHLFLENSDDTVFNFTAADQPYPIPVVDIAGIDYGFHPTLPLVSGEST